MIQTSRFLIAKRRSAFTLLELLAVVGIITVLMAVLFPSLSGARQQAQQARCQANMHGLGVATQMYLNEFNGEFWPYYYSVSGGCLWWFGFELNGPGDTFVPNRPLDKQRAILTKQQGYSTGNNLECPVFPYNEPFYFPKFNQRSATYGYNLELSKPLRMENSNQPDRPWTWSFEGGQSSNDSTKRLSYYQFRAHSVFVFVDAVHFDFPDRFMEGHYVEYQVDISNPSGYGHFRHQQKANVLYLDNHIEPQSLRGPAYQNFDSVYPAGNLADDSSGFWTYGF